MSIPIIQTAIPRRRYQLGEFNVTVLGDIESPDPVRYRFIMAISRDPDPKPGIFISAAHAGNAGFSMTVSMADGAQSLGDSSRWGELDLFVEDALAVASRMLNLSDEAPQRLM